MVIAVGTEGTDGTIPTSDLRWTYVPSGNDALDAVSYAGVVDATNPSIELKNENGTGSTVAGISVIAG